MANPPSTPKKKIQGKSSPLIRAGDVDKRRHPRHVVTKRYPVALTSIVVLEAVAPSENTANISGEEKKADGSTEQQTVLENPIEGYITNVNSPGIGMGIMLSERVEPRTQIRFELKQMPFPVSLVAVVRWCGPIPTSGHVIKTPPEMKWRVGIQVVPGSEENEKVLQKIVDKLMGL